MNKKKLLAYTLVPMFGLSLAGTGMVYAKSMSPMDIDPAAFADRQESMFEQQADLLGVDVNVIKSGWAEGKTLKDIAEEQGIDLTTLQQKMHQQRLDNMKERLQTLVDQGIITQDQMNTRLTFMENNQRNQDQNESSSPRGGRGGGFGF